ncbi:hypothetical protein HYFRA_00003553 [Hymenoscyphus fraxineus]|uniref:Uncharacterized protein n=1 Tax=Hymenoscyphus fraxineus TaxID=746836 RepID=A0A9N9KWM7_9HELO|nr:hypothetical protein HYFRA_00003553 [Hymenoscyphus fraxineus]
MAKPLFVYPTCRRNKCNNEGETMSWDKAPLNGVHIDVTCKAASYLIKRVVPDEAEHESLLKKRVISAK